MERAFDSVTVTSEDAKTGTIKCRLDELTSKDAVTAKVTNRQLKITATVDGKLYAKNVGDVNDGTVAKAQAYKKYVEVKVDKGTPTFNLNEKI